MGFLGLLKKAFMALIVLVLLLELPLFFIALSVQPVAFDANTYKNALDESGFYDKAPALAAQTLAEGMPLPIDLAGLLPKPWLKAQAESVLDQVFAYVNGASESTAITVSLAEVKAGILEKLPILPPQMLSQFPDSVDIAAQMKLEPVLIQARQAASMAGLAVAVLGAVALLFLGLLALLAWKLKSILRWVGFPVMVAGLLCLAIAFFGSAAASSAIAQISSGDPVSSAVVPVAVVLLKTLVGRVYLVAGIAFLLGAAMFAASFLLKEAPAEEKKQAEADGKNAEQKQAEEDVEQAEPDSGQKPKGGKQEKKATRKK